MSIGRSLPLRSQLPVFVCLVVGALVFLNRFGSAVLDPTQREWLLAHGDAAMNQLGWEFYRSDPWAHPIGRISSYQAPVGTAIALTDSVPLLAIPLKLLRGVLPQGFQYLGVWQLLNHLLQAGFGYLLARRLVRDPWLAMLGGVAFLLVPSFLFRHGHAALSAHWTLLWALYAYLATSTRSMLSYLRNWLPLCAIVAWVHPYLAIMVLAIAIADGVKRTFLRELKFRAFVGGATVLGLVLGFLWYEAGYLIFTDAYMPGVARYYDYAMNLNALWNPLGTSLLLQDRPVHWGGMEGYNYLGLGLSLLAIVAISVLPIFPRLRLAVARHMPVALLLILLTCTALTNRLMYGEVAIGEWQVPSAVARLAEMFRGSGRFFWPVLYASCAFAILAMSNGLPKSVSLGMMGCVVVIQAVDMWPQLRYQRHFVEARFESRLRSPIWQELTQHIDRIMAIPPWRSDTQAPKDFVDFSLLALDSKAILGAGYSTRISRSREAAHLSAVRSELLSAPAGRTIYLLGPGALKDIQARPDLIVTSVDGFIVGWSNSIPVNPPFQILGGPLNLAQYLQKYEENVILVTVMDEATLHLDDSSRDQLRTMQSQVDDLEYRGSYAAVIRKGIVLVQKLDNDAAVEIELLAGADLGSWVVPRDVHLSSAGFVHGNLASTQIAAERIGLPSRGFNVVTCDDELRVLDLARFDTFTGPMGFSYRPAQSTTGLSQSSLE